MSTNVAFAVAPPESSRRFTTVALRLIMSTLRDLTEENTKLIELQYLKGVGYRFLRIPLSKQFEKLKSE